MTSSLRFASSEKLRVPDQVPAKRSAEFAAAFGVVLDAQALTGKLKSIARERIKSFLFIDFLFL